MQQQIYHPVDFKKEMLDDRAGKQELSPPSVALIERYFKPRKHQLLAPRGEEPSQTGRLIHRYDTAPVRKSARECATESIELLSHRQGCSRQVDTRFALGHLCCKLLPGFVGMEL